MDLVDTPNTQHPTRAHRVLFFKGEAYSRERNALFSYAPPPEEAGGYGDGSPYAPVWGSTNPLLRPTAKRQGPPALQRAALAGVQERVRVKALGTYVCTDGLVGRMHLQ